MKKYWEQLEVGYKIEPLKKTPISRVQISKFAAASNDFSPLHVDEEFAKNAGFPSVFASNLFSMAAVEEAFFKFASNISPLSFSCTFQRIIWPSDILTAHAMLTRKFESNQDFQVEFSFWCQNQTNEVVAKGFFTCLMFKNIDHETKSKQKLPVISEKVHLNFNKKCSEYLQNYETAQKLTIPERDLV